jgi:hypothetical protein
MYTVTLMTAINTATIKRLRHGHVSFIGEYSTRWESALRLGVRGNIDIKKLCRHSIGRHGNLSVRHGRARPGHLD